MGGGTTMNIPDRLHFLQCGGKGYLGYVSARPSTRKSKVFGFKNIEDVFHARRVIADYGTSITLQIEQMRSGNYMTPKLPESKISWRERRMALGTLDIEHIDTEQAVHSMSLNNLNLVIVSRSWISDNRLMLRALTEFNRSYGHEENVSRLNLMMLDD